MTGVSTRAVSGILRAGRERGIPPADLCRGLSESLVELTAPGGRVAWEVFAQISERLGGKIGGPEALRSLGKEQVSNETLRIFRRVGRVLTHPRDLYFMGARWAGPSLFPMIRAEIEERPDGTLVQRLSLPADHRDCPTLFHIIHGTLTACPDAWGHGQSEVELELTPRHATYTVHMVPSSRGWLTGLLTGIRARLVVPRMLDELEKQQSKIDENYLELRNAHDRIARQTSDLERVNSIGRELSQQIDLDRVAEVLIRVLLVELGTAGAELWLIRSETTASHPDEREVPRFFRRGGTSEGEPTSRYALESAGHPVGTLHVWWNGDDGRVANSELLDRLLPWIAIALDNARSYAALEEHAADLEQRIEERTARLLTANHHLVREIDERRRASEALLQSEIQLRASERLASVGTLAAGIAHEINNPIGMILAASQLAQMLGDDANGNAEVRAALIDIESQARRCGEIVRSVLQFSREERTQKWECRLADIASRSVQLTKAFADEHDAQIRIDLTDPSPWVCVNPIQIEQAIVNLLRNAVESGAKHIQLSLSERPPEERARIEIRDDGPGIPDRDQMRIFDPFYTTRRDVGGTGLGLSVVHGIASEHGGTLAVDTLAEGGLVASLELPTVPAPAKPLGKKREAPPQS